VRADIRRAVGKQAGDTGDMSNTVNTVTVNLRERREG
jgi:hypothetical protein